jgi:hypothetical protein
MPLDRYRQLQGVFEALTDDDLFQQRARRIDPRAVEAARAAEARRDEELERYRELESRLDESRDESRAERRRRRPPRRPRDDIDRLFSEPMPATVKEEFEELPASKFYAKLATPECRICFDIVHDETGEEVTIACRHPQLPDGSDVCGGAYHLNCISKLKESLRHDFHCCRCFAGRNTVPTRNAEGVVVGEHVPPFHLFYRLRNPVTPAEAIENEEYQSAQAAMAMGGPAAMAVPPTREEMREQMYRAAQQRQQENEAQRDETRGRERDEDNDETSGKKSKRRGGKKYKRTFKKYR